MKSPTKYLFLVIILLGSINGQGHGFELSGEVKVQYVVLLSSETENGWFDVNFAQSRYHVLNGTIINVTIADIQDEQTHLDIQIGNVSFSNILDSEIENNLALGYWSLGYSLGFVANDSWLAISEAVDALEDVEAGLEMDVEENALNGTIIATRVGFVDGFQLTELTYDQENRLLIEANIVIGNFELYFEIYSINGNTAYYLHEDHSSISSNDESGLNANLIMLVSSLFVINYSLTRRRK